MNIIFLLMLVLGTTSEMFSIPRTTLRGYIKRIQQQQPGDWSVDNLQIGFSRHNQIFSPDQEQILSKYIKRAAEIYFGLSPKDIRVLTFQCAKKFEIVTPASWEDKKRAGPYLFTGFMKRNPSLSIRTPEATSIGRASAFNPKNVKRFFSKLVSLVDRYQFHAKDIWNIDETGVTTVQKPQKIVATKGVKQIGSLTSGERGTLVTVCAEISAIVQASPPFFVFPRVNFKEHLLRGAPTGSRGSSHKSGWMTADNFFKVYAPL